MAQGFWVGKTDVFGLIFREKMSVLQKANYSSGGQKSLSAIGRVNVLRTFI